MATNSELQAAIGNPLFRAMQGDVEGSGPKDEPAPEVQVVVEPKQEAPAVMDIGPVKAIDAKYEAWYVVKGVAGQCKGVHTDGRMSFQKVGASRRSFLQPLEIIVPYQGNFSEYGENAPKAAVEDAALKYVANSIAEKQKILQGANGQGTVMLIEEDFLPSEDTPKEEVTLPVAQVAGGNLPALKDDYLELLKEIDPELAQMVIDELDNQPVVGKIQFPQIKMVKCGAGFKLPDGSIRQELEGYILFVQSHRRMWPAGSSPEDPVPPECYSDDGLHSYGGERYAAVCASCQWDKLGTALKGNQKGKRCPNRNRMFVWIREFGEIPVLFDLPGTQTRALNNHRLQVSQKGYRLIALKTRFKTVARDGDKNDNSDITFAVLKERSPEELIKAVVVLRDFLKDIKPSEVPPMGASNTAATSVQLPGDAGMKPQVDI